MCLPQIRGKRFTYFPGEGRWPAPGTDMRCGGVTLPSKGSTGRDLCSAPVQLEGPGAACPPPPLSVSVSSARALRPPRCEHRPGDNSRCSEVSVGEEREQRLLPRRAAQVWGWSSPVHLLQGQWRAQRLKERASPGEGRWPPEGPLTQARFHVSPASGSGQHWTASRSHERQDEEPAAVSRGSSHCSSASTLVADVPLSRPS